MPPTTAASRDLHDIAWFNPSGEHMLDEAWHQDFARAVMVFLNGEAIGEPGLRGEPIIDDSFLLLYNASHEDIDFTMPTSDFGTTWTCVLDTDDNLPGAQEVKATETVKVTGRSTVVLTRRPGAVSEPIPAEDDVPVEAPAEKPADKPVDKAAEKSTPKKPATRSRTRKSPESTTR